MLKRACHPGRVLRDELAELGVTPTEFARQIGVPANRISQIINERRSITGDTALRFGHWFGVEPQLWLSLQAHLDIVRAKEKPRDAISSTWQGYSVTSPAAAATPPPPRSPPAPAPRR